MAESVIEVVLRARNLTRQAIRQLQADLETVRRATTDAASSSEDLNRSLSSVGQGSNARSAVAGIASLRDRLREARDSARELNERMEQAAEGARKLADFFLLVGGAGTAAFTDVTVQAATFERTLSQVQAISGASTSELARLEAQARSLGSSTEFTASQAAEGLVFLAQAGLSIEQQLSALPGTLELAAAGGLDLARASDIATNVLSGFGLAVEELTRVNDVLARTATTSNTNVAELAEAFTDVGPVAAAAGEEIETISGFLATLADAGIKGGEAGTALRNILLRLANPPADAADALRRLGVEVTDLDGGVRPLADVLGDLASRTVTTSDAAAIFGVRAAAAGSVIVNNFSRAASAIQDFNTQAAGTASRIARLRTDNLVGDFRSLLSALESLRITLGNELIPTLREMVQSFTQAVNAAREWFEALGPGERQLLVLAAATSAAVLGLGLLIRLFAALIPGVIRLGTTAGIAATNFTAFSAAITTASAGATTAAGRFTLLTATLGTARTAALALNAALVGVGALFIGFEAGQFIVQELVDNLGALENAVQSVKDNVSTFSFAGIFSDAALRVIRLVRQELDNIGRVDLSTDAADLFRNPIPPEVSNQVASFRRQLIALQEATVGEGLIDDQAINDAVTKGLISLDRITAKLAKGLIDSDAAAKAAADVFTAFSEPLQELDQLQQQRAGAEVLRQQQRLARQRQLERQAIQARLDDETRLQASLETLRNQAVTAQEAAQRRLIQLQQQGSSAQVEVQAQGAERLRAITERISDLQRGDQSDFIQQYQLRQEITRQLADVQERAASAQTEADRDAIQASIDRAARLSEELDGTQQQVSALRRVQAAQEAFNDAALEIEQRIAQGQFERAAQEAELYGQRITEQRAKVSDLNAELSKIPEIKTVDIAAQNARALEAIEQIQQRLNALDQRDIEIDVIVNTRRGAQDGGFIRPTAGLFSQGGWIAPDSSAVYSIPNVFDLMQLGGRVGKHDGRHRMMTGGQVPVLLEDGEFIVPRKRARQFAPLLSAINYGDRKRVRPIRERMMSAKRRLPQGSSGRGGRLPGYGGGDRRAFDLRSGDFVVRKERTREFEPLLRAIVSNRPQQVSAIMDLDRMARATGGFIGDTHQVVQALQGGGTVVRSLDNQSTVAPDSSNRQERITERVALELTINGEAPRTLLGDRATVESVVRGLSDLSKTLGGSSA